MTIEAMKLALEALEEAHPKPYNESVTSHIEAITALRTAIAEAEKQEPVAWVCYGAPGKRDIDFEETDINRLPTGTLLYTTPPAAQPAPVQEPTAMEKNGGKTGWPPGLLQDDSKQLSKWLASKPDARQKVREALDKKAENARELGLDYEPASEEDCRAATGLIAFVSKQQPAPAAPVQEPVVDHSCKDTYELIMKWADIYAAQTGNLYAQAAQDPSKTARMADERTMLACVVAQAVSQPPEPDLLNALKRILDEPNNTMSDGKALKEIIRIARAAITKATGEKT